VNRAFAFGVPVAVAVFAVATIFFGEELAAMVARFSLGCPSRRWLGLACPGCGGTRAFCALLHGEFFAAAKLNPWWIPSAFILANEWFFASFPQRTSGERAGKFRAGVASIYATGTLVFCVVRNIFDF